MTGENIQVAGATIDASGRDGGGKVLIGGDWGGGNPNRSLVSNQSAKLEGYAIANATTVSVDAATRINASAKDRGNGGKVVVWSDQTTTFAGTIMALGGSQFGNGGFVETSGHDVLNFTGDVDTRAPNGVTGTLLLDPHDITVVQTGNDFGLGQGGTTALQDSSVIKVSTLQTLLATSSIVLNTGTTPSAQHQQGNITFDIGAVVNWTGPSTFTVSAARDITFLQGSGITNTGGGNLVLRADNTGTGTGKVNFFAANGIDFRGSTGTVSIYYNPDANPTSGLNKYQNPTTFNSNFFGNASQLATYMLVNTVADLTLIGTNVATLGQRYALGGDINMGSTPFAPLGNFTGILTAMAGWERTTRLAIS